MPSALGLTGDELMIPELQDRLGQWILKTQGTRAWEGYRAPRTDFTPDTSAPYGGRDPNVYSTRDTAETLAAGARFQTVFDAVCPRRCYNVPINLRIPGGAASPPL